MDMSTITFLMYSLSWYLFSFLKTISYFFGREGVSFAYEKFVKIDYDFSDIMGVMHIS